MTTIFVNMLAFATLLSSVFSITSKNPVISVIFLISTFVSGAGYLILIGINFVGISYIIVYVGAIAVLFLFVIMLLNIRLAEITEVGTQYFKVLPLAFVISSLFLYLFFIMLPVIPNNVAIVSYLLSSLSKFNSFMLSSNISAYNIENVINNSSLWPNIDTLMTSFTQIETLGFTLYTNQATLLIVLSMILLLAMFATIVINKDNNCEQNPQSKSPYPETSLKVNLKRTVFGVQGETAKRHYHSSSQRLTITKPVIQPLNPWLVTGFTDAEGCFSARLLNYQDKKYFISPVFSFHMHLNELEFINNLRDFFGVGSVRTDKTSVHYQVTGIKNLLIVLEHFKKYPLQSSKKHSLYIFSIILNIMAKKEHLTNSGILKAISYINFLNKPISTEGLDRITKIIGPVPLLSLPPVPIISNLAILNPYWIVGFVMGEGSFTYARSVSFNKKTNETRVYISMEFSISQLKLDTYLLKSIANHIGAGHVKVYDDKPMVNLRIYNAKVIQNLILPFFSYYPLLGNKKIQYDIWLKAVLLIFTDPNYSKKRQESLIKILITLAEHQSRKQKDFLAKFLETNIDLVISGDTDSENLTN